MIRATHLLPLALAGSIFTAPAPAVAAEPAGRVCSLITKGDYAPRTTDASPRVVARANGICNKGRLRQVKPDPFIIQARMEQRHGIPGMYRWVPVSSGRRYDGSATEATISVPATSGGRFRARFRMMRNGVPGPWVASSAITTPYKPNPATVCSLTNHSTCKHPPLQG